MIVLKCLYSAQFFRYKEGLSPNKKRNYIETRGVGTRRISELRNWINWIGHDSNSQSITSLTTNVCQNIIICFASWYKWQIFTSQFISTSLPIRWI